MNGGGAAGLSLTQLLLSIGIKNLIVGDTKGAIFRGRKENMNGMKTKIAEITNPKNEEGDLPSILKGADVFVGVSAAGALKGEWIKNMNSKPIILALANPVPEIMPDEAKKSGAFIVCTGRSDFKNQVNNSLAFPGIFRGTLDVKSKEINQEMKLAAAKAIAGLILEYELTVDYVIPSALDTRVPVLVAMAVAEAAISTGVARADIDPSNV